MHLERSIQNKSHWGLPNIMVASLVLFLQLSHLGMFRLRRAAHLTGPMPCVNHCAVKIARLRRSHITSWDLRCIPWPAMTDMWGNNATKLPPNDFQLPKIKQSGSLVQAPSPRASHFSSHTLHHTQKLGSLLQFFDCCSCCHVPPGMCSLLRCLPDAK